MRLTYRSLIFLASALSFIETKPDVDVIKKMSQDLNSSPSGYNFYHHSGSVHPGGYNAKVNHGGGKNFGQIYTAERIPEVDRHGKGGSYRVSGGYGFMISHDYGSQQNHPDASRAVPHFGSSNIDVEKKPAVSSIDMYENVVSVSPKKNEGLDGYVGKEMYGSYLEYDKLVKDGKKEPSVNPGEYYGSDNLDGKEKYDSDEESNNGRDKLERYLESEKYDESQNYKENGNYGDLGGNSDYDFHGGETEKYLFPSYGSENVNDMEKAESHEGYTGASEDDYEKFEPYKTHDEIVNHYSDYLHEPSSTYFDFGEYNTEPKFGDTKNYFLDDFFKEYKQFSDGHKTGVNYDDDHGYDDEYNRDHSYEDETSMYAEDGKGGEGFFDEEDMKGDHYEVGDSKKDSSFGNKKGHKKGSKTTGYQNVLHKDEFTKDHTFYEHAKKDGDFDKAGDYNEHDSQNEEGHGKSGHHRSSSDHDHRGKTDSHDKGHDFDDDISGHDEHGYKSYFDDNSRYNNRGDYHHGSEYGEGYDH